MSLTTFFDDKFAYILSADLSTAQRDQLVSDGWKYVCNPKSANPEVKGHRCYRKPRTGIILPSNVRCDVAVQTSAPPEEEYISDHDVAFATPLRDEFDMYDQLWD